MGYSAVLEGVDSDLLTGCSVFVLGTWVGGDLFGYNTFLSIKCIVSGRRRFFTFLHYFV
jgi:hypothetical protein